MFDRILAVTIYGVYTIIQRPAFALVLTKNGVVSEYMPVIAIVSEAIS